jgi:cytochrome c-type biogenesis protein CcmH/NrfF
MKFEFSLCDFATLRRRFSLFVCVYLRLSAVAALLLAAPLMARAGEAVPTENDPVAAARAVQLANELRCLVCQNQSFVVLVWQLRARRRREQPALTPEERARAERLLLRGPDARS